jgi:DNA-binding MarR family transcriptional regulator
MALVRTYEASMAMVNKALRHHGLSAAGRQTLAVLEGAGRPLSPTTISERLLVTTASVTSLLDTLERRGLVARLRDPDDRRKLLVSLTEEGQQIIDQLLPEVVALQTAVMARLGEAERQRLLRSLDAIREAVAVVDADSVVAAAPRRVKPPRD